MRTFGIVGLIVSILVIMFAFGMDTSVPSSSGGRVVNLGLMRDQSNFLNFGFVLFIGSILMIGFGKKSQPETKEHKVPTDPIPVKGKKAPPFTGYVCPNCGNNTPQDADECSMCHASFGPTSSWNPVKKP